MERTRRKPKGGWHEAIDPVIGPDANEAERHLSPERLNTLVDAVYAIIMTLLVLDLRLPEGLSVGETVSRLPELGPKFTAFLIGFGVVGSGWAYVHQINGLFTKSNLLHLAINLAALMIASLIPFGASLMGAFPNASYGPAFYAIDVAVLTGLYGLDLLVGQRELIPPVVDRRFLRTVSVLIAMAVSWCLFVGLVIAPLRPTWALWLLGLHFVTHWTLLFATERNLRRAVHEARRWAEA